MCSNFIFEFIGGGSRWQNEGLPPGKHEEEENEDMASKTFYNLIAHT